MRHRALSCRFVVLGLGLMLVAARAEPLTWERCLALAAEHNPQLRLAQTRFQEVDGRILEFHANYLPHVTAEATTLPVRATFDVRQVVYNAALSPGEKIVRLQRVSARTNLELTVTEMVYALRQQYLEAEYFAELAAQRHEFAASLEKMKPRTQALFDAGRVAKVAVERLEVRRSQAEADASDTDAQAIQARIALDNLMGLNPPPPDPVAGRIVGTIPEELNLSVLTETALRERRDLRLLETLVLSDREEIRVAGAPGYPAIFLFATLNSEPVRPSFLNSLQNDHGKLTDFRAGALGQWRIFDAGETAGRVVSAHANARETEIRAAALKRDIPGQVEQAVAAVKAGVESLEALRLGPEGDRMVQLAQEDLEQGKTGALDVLEAQFEEQRRREALLTARFHMDQAGAALERATGRMVKILSDDKAAGVRP